MQSPPVSVERWLNWQGAEALIKEAAMLFETEPAFDEKAHLFQLQNCVLDLSKNTFRSCCPPDMTRRCSPVSIPESRLQQPSRIPAESDQMRAEAW
eukprot:11186967-Lingulodinium_polyedra.AAC.1